MKQAKIFKTINTNYKDGFIQCNCGYKKELGNGFNQYFIENCPECTKELETRTQRKVIYHDKTRNSLCADIGRNEYFILSNGIHVRFTHNTHRIYGTEKYLDGL